MGNSELLGKSLSWTLLFLESSLSLKLSHVLSNAWLSAHLGGFPASLEGLQGSNCHPFGPNVVDHKVFLKGPRGMWVFRALVKRVWQVFMLDPNCNLN